MVITGGSGGLGIAIGRLAAARGFAVCVNFVRNEAAAEELVSAITGVNGTAIAVQADVSTLAGAQALFAQATDRLGPPDALVNSAGIVGGASAITDIDEERLQRVFGANVFSVFYCCREAVRRMSTARGGRGGAIVNLSSAAARHGGMTNEVHYAASKGAVDSFTVALAKEVGRQGIRVNTLRPGVIRTSMHDEHGGEQAFNAALPSIPLGRIGAPDEVAEAAVWLASDASSYVHGAVLDVSGGR
jgi:NAD(P)-dependent dehydrogenase (short-subunit alcohol dehydrogenase family)